MGKSWGLRKIHHLQLKKYSIKYHFNPTKVIRKGVNEVGSS